MKIDESIFKAYDIRGIVGVNLDEEVVEKIGKAFGTMIKRSGGNRVVCGMDIREHSPVLTKSLIKGVLSTGVDVDNIGQVVTPNMYFACHKYDVAGGLMVTASHNPAQYNGVKMTMNKMALTSQKIQELKDMILRSDFNAGEGKVRDLTIAVDEYLTEIVKKNPLKKKLSVVVDPSNASAALVMPKLMALMGCELIMINGEVDPKFSTHSPDPVVLDNYGKLLDKINEVGADMGVMFDGDADRVGFVDNMGNIWFGDKIEILLARDILPRHPGSKVIVEMKNSEAVVEEVIRLGGEPIFGQTGHTLIEEKLHEVGAILAAEMSCHYYIADEWYKFDDAIYAMARVMRIIADSGRNFSDLMLEIPNYPSIPEYRVAVPEERKLAIVKEVVDYCRDKCDKYIDIDGIRGYVEDGWFIVRSSNTQPLLSLRAEAKTVEGLEKIKKFVKDKMDTIEGVNLDWNRQVDEA